MARQLRPLASDDLTVLPAGCRGCLFWELGTPAPDERAVGVLVGAPREDLPSRPVERKRAWVAAQVEAGTPPGRVALVDGEVAGYALFGPARAFARRRPPAPAVSPDAVLLATAWVDPSHRDGGLGRLLVQAAIKDALRLDLTAVEAYGDRRFHERSCVLPATWLLHEGFVVHREHPRTPLFRLDVRRTVRWAGSLEHALGEVLGHLPRRSPLPVPERFEPSGPATS
jgi:GNAT superfamily N-acetyltransferase